MQKRKWMFIVYAVAIGSSWIGLEHLSDITSGRVLQAILWTFVGVWLPFGLLTLGIMLGVVVRDAEVNKNDEPVRFFPLEKKKVA